MKKLIISYFLITILSISCGREKKEVKIEFQPLNEEIVTDFYNFKHYLDDNNYAYDIKITDIIVTEHKDKFEIEKEKYTIPEKINGTSVTIKFDITNPYNKTMRIPFSEYYEIGTEEFENVDGYSYNRNLQTYVGYADKIEDSKGLPLYSFAKWTDAENSRKLTVDFKPNETKSIVVKFTKPFPNTIQKITFIGFNKYLKKVINNFDDLNEAEQEKYLAEKNSQYGLVIDLKTKKIIDLISIEY